MKEILVTGGTGVLGRHIVRRLDGLARVRVLSRSGGECEGARVMRGDLETGEGVRDAAEGVDTIVHAATIGFDLRRPDRDLGAARRLLSSAEGEPHIVYVSIVGVDMIPYGYYQTKLAVEEMIIDSGMPWTILRATQFHELVLSFLSLLAKPPVAVVPRGVRAQPVDAKEVADRLAELALGTPAGRAPDMGGPRVERADDLMRAYLAAAGRRRPIVRVPFPGKTMAAYRAGHHTTPAHATGSRSFTEYLRDRLGSAGTLDPPYDFGRR